MKQTTIALMLATSMFVSACWETKAKTVVVLIDATMSVDPAEYLRCRDEINRLVTRLDRGDRLVLVPITGEPEELLGHRMVHIDMPSERVPYDSNLKKAKEQAVRQVEQFLTTLPNIQAKYTDILGAMRATQDALGESADLIILSDMVIDTPELHFPTAPELANTRSAELLAEKLATKQQLKGVNVKVGILRSFDLERMSSARRDGVQAFWRRYFAVSGATKVQITVDLQTLSE